VGRGASHTHERESEEEKQERDSWGGGLSGKPIRRWKGWGSRLLFLKRRGNEIGNL